MILSNAYILVTKNLLMIICTLLKKKHTKNQEQSDKKKKWYRIRNIFIFGVYNKFLRNNISLFS